MKLEQYIIKEGMVKKMDIDVHDFAELVKASCQPYLRAVPKANAEYLLYRGMGQARTDKFFESKVRKRRKPKDSSLQLHKEMNAAFKEKFGINARSETLFAYARDGRGLGTGDTYGTNYYIFPVGNFSIIYSPSITDLYIEADRTFTNDSLIDADPKFALKAKDIINAVPDESLPVGILDDKEMWLKEKNVRIITYERLDRQPREYRLVYQGHAYSVKVPPGNKVLTRKHNAWKKWKRMEMIKDYKIVNNQIPMKFDRMARVELMVKCDYYYAMKVQYVMSEEQQDKNFWTKFNLV